MHIHAVCDPEISAKFHNMLQIVMVSLLCGSLFGRGYIQALDLIVAQSVALSDEAHMSSPETDTGKVAKTVSTKATATRRQR